MIAWINGTVLEKEPPRVVINNNGIGYEVDVSMTTFAKLPELEQTISLFIHTHIREDAHLLFGFYDKKERTLFKKLIKVNGVGPKLALTILSNVSPQSFVQLVQSHNVDSLVKVPGIGKKTAERILIELQNSFDDIAATSPVNELMNNTSAHNEALGALKSLGYKPFEVKKVLGELGDALSSEEMIRKALQALSTA